MSKSRMVLRSVHLPEETDEALRTLAFQSRVSKADLIRQLIDSGLRRYTKTDDPVGLILDATNGTQISSARLKLLRDAVENLMREREESPGRLPRIPSAA